MKKLMREDISYAEREVCIKTLFFRYFREYRCRSYFGAGSALRAGAVTAIGPERYADIAGAET